MKTLVLFKSRNLIMPTTHIYSFSKKIFNTHNTYFSVFRDTVHKTAASMFLSKSFQKEIAQKFYSMIKDTLKKRYMDACSLHLFC